MSNASSGPLPRSFGLSALLHSMLVGALIFTAWWSRRQEKPPEAIFELVAGPGDNYAATEAPTTTAEVPNVTLRLPEPLPEPKPRPPQPQPKPQPEPPPPKPAPKPVEKKPTPTPTPIKIEPVPEKPPIKIEEVREKVSFSDFAKENGKPTAKPTTRPPTPIKTQSINVGKITAAAENTVTVGAGGTAMTTQEINLSKAYVALIIQRIRQSMEAAGINDVRSVGVEFRVSLRGAISNARIIKSSGNSKFDQAVLAAFRSIRPIGEPPTGRAEIFRTVIRLTEG
jgi:colicin import membrane protein